MTRCGMRGHRAAACGRVPADRCVRSAETTTSPAVVGTRRAAGDVRRVLPRLAGALTLALAMPLAAHEYWLDPLDATPDVDGSFLANVRNGQDFTGTSLPFDPGRMSGVVIVGPDGARALAGRLGDYPALRAEIGRAGVYLVAFETYAKPLLYDDREAFATFLEYHGLGALLEAHDARGLPEEGIRERYFRYVKTLVKTGDADTPGEPGSAAFAPLGHRYELVAENDPYVNDELVLRVLFEGKAVAEAQVELFERTPEDVVSRVTDTTAADGRVRFDVARAGDYLVNAVRVLEPAEGTPIGEETAPPHWESLWASLTFERR